MFPLDGFESFMMNRSLASAVAIWLDMTLEN